MRARGGLARLSLNNQLLVALSCPDATFVAGFKAWLALGYCVRKGESAIRIIAPMPIKDRDDDRQSDEEAQPRLLFKAVSVFDRSQVAPLAGVEPTPVEPPCEPLTATRAPGRSASPSPPTPRTGNDPANGSAPPGSRRPAPPTTSPATAGPRSVVPPGRPAGTSRSCAGTA